MLTDRIGLHHNLHILTVTNGRVQEAHEYKWLKRLTNGWLGHRRQHEELRHPRGVQSRATSPLHHETHQFTLVQESGLDPGSWMAPVLEKKHLSGDTKAEVGHGSDTSRLTREYIIRISLLLELLALMLQL